MDTTAVVRAIEKGPSKDRLFDAMKFTYDQDVDIPIQFYVVVGYSAPVDHPGCMVFYAGIKNLRITSLEYEDGSGDSFNIRGFCDTNADTRTNSTYEHCKFKAYYNTVTRKGSMEFLHT